MDLTGGVQGGAVPGRVPGCADDTSRESRRGGTDAVKRLAPRTTPSAPRPHDSASEPIPDDNRSTAPRGRSPELPAVRSRVPQLTGGPLVVFIGFRRSVRRTAQTQWHPEEGGSMRFIRRLFS